MSRSDTSRPGNLVRQSPGKINLFLEVMKRRPDGYHELETVMARISLTDTLSFSDRNDGVIQLTLSGFAGPLAQAARATKTNPLEFPSGESNLITRAARALQRHTGCRHGASIHICKRIPGQAGLGGGSGNAATTLLSLNQLWNLNVPPSELHQIAATLGSDVNFLLCGSRAAVCQGRGEQVRPVETRGIRHGVLLVPFSGNATSEVFAALQIPEHPRDPGHCQRLLRNAALTEAPDQCFNRLQSPAEQINPHVSRALSWLQLHAGNGHLTGSGSGCFALVQSAALARRLLRRFTANTHMAPSWASATAFRF